MAPAKTNGAMNSTSSPKPKKVKGSKAIKSKAKKAIGATSPKKTGPKPISGKDSSNEIESRSSSISNGSGILPRIANKLRDYASPMSTYNGSPSQSSSSMALRTIEQLAILLADPLLNQQTDDEGANSVLLAVNPNKSSSAPGSRRTSVAPPVLPRHTSDSALLAQNMAKSGGEGNDRDVKRKIAKQCLELKRILDKEGPVMSSESLVHRNFFSKTSTLSGISVLLKCIQNVNDIDISIVVTNLLLRLINTSDGSATPTVYMVKRNASTSLMKCLQACGNCSSNYVKSTTERNSSGNLVAGLSPALVATSSINGWSRIDDAILNLFTIMVKIGRYDSKLALMARIHGTLEIMVETLRKWQERKEVGASSIGLQVLRVVAIKNALLKLGALDVIQHAVRTYPVNSTKDPKELAYLEAAFDLLSVFAKLETSVVEILNLLGLRFFLGAFSACSGNDSMQRAILKLLRAIADTDVGKKAFSLTDGVEVLTTALEGKVERTHWAHFFSPKDLSILTFLTLAEAETLQSTGVSSIPTLIIAVLRSAVSEADLPHLDRIEHRYFPIDEPLSLSTVSEPKDLLSRMYSSSPKPPRSARSLRLSRKLVTSQTDSGTVSLPPSPPTSSAVSTPPVDETTLRDFCPELALLDWEPPPTSGYAQRTVKCVYPTSTTFHGVAPNLNRPRNHYTPSYKPVAGDFDPRDLLPCPIEAEPLLRRSNNDVKRAIYEQTARILRPSLYTNYIVYDVMDESARREAQLETPE
ncbi:hypothetical protein HDU76_001171 [Blyttiomyces sp. JEL0837]|nr:hypothetical protein HDU76_001171 [Blyttiomyces sp. JEL0837]